MGADNGVSDSMQHSVTIVRLCVSRRPSGFPDLRARAQGTVTYNHIIHRRRTLADLGRAIVAVTRRRGGARSSDRAPTLPRIRQLALPISRTKYLVFSPSISDVKRRQDVHYTDTFLR